MRVEQTGSFLCSSLYLTSLSLLTGKLAITTFISFFVLSLHYPGSEYLPHSLVMELKTKCQECTDFSMGCCAQWNIEIWSTIVEIAVFLVASYPFVWNLTMVLAPCNKNGLEKVFPGDNM